MLEVLTFEGIIESSRAALYQITIQTGDQHQYDENVESSEARQYNELKHMHHNLLTSNIHTRNVNLT